MKQGARILIGAGIVALFSGVLVGGLSTGYRLQSGGFLIRVGVVYLLFGAVLWRVGLRGVTEAIGITACTFAVLYITGVVLMYHHFFIMPSELARQPSVSTLLRTQAEYSLLLAPVSTGYLAGILIKREHLSTKLAGVGATLLTAVVGWALASSLVMNGQLGLVFIILALVAGAGVVAAIVPILVILREENE